MTQLKTINLYFVLKRKLIPTAVGEDIRKKNNQEKQILWYLSMFIKLVSIKWIQTLLRQETSLFITTWFWVFVVVVKCNNYA